MFNRMVTYQKIVFSILLASLIFSSASANNGIGRILDTQEDGRIVINSDCETTITFRVNVANWMPGLPVDLPPMYLIYEIPGLLAANYAEVKPSEFADYGQSISGHTIHEWHLPVTVNLENYLLNNEAPVLGYKLRLVSAPIGGISSSNPFESFYDYPVYYFIESDQFFSCQYLDISFGQEVDPPDCDVEIPSPFPYATFQIGALEVLNNGCLVGDFQTGGSTLQAPPSKEAQSHSALNDHENNLTAISFTPNPFSSELIAPLEVAKDTDMELVVFDASGKVVHQQTQYLQKGMHQIYLDTPNWPQGLYYARVKTGNDIQTHRLVKTNTN